MMVSATSALSLRGLSEPPAQGILPPTTLLPNGESKTSLAGNFGRLPLSFESNRGQTDARARFLTHSGDTTIFLTPSEAVFSMPARANTPHKEKHAMRKSRQTQRSYEQNSLVALRMQMVGANSGATALQQQPLEGKVNYFLGKDPGKWHAGVPTFGRVGFHEVYQGVDLVYYGNQRRLEYDFVVAPHADPTQIQLHFAGAEGVHIDAAGDLRVHVQGREMKWRKPLVYQQDAAGKHSVAARFRLKRLPDGQAGIGFALGRYDADRPLVLDPVLISSTYLGGSAGDQGTSIALDSSGSAYITGSASSLDFPTTSGAFQRTKGVPTNSSIAFVSKFNSTGTALVYSTYLGGSTGDQGTGIAVDSSGNAYVTGVANSSDFPTTPGAFQRVKVNANANAFVTQLNATGTALVYSTFLGGSTGDQGTGIALDAGSNAYVSGFAASADFPTTPGAFQRVKSGGALTYNAFLTNNTFAKILGLGKASFSSFSVVQ